MFDLSYQTIVLLVMIPGVAAILAILADYLTTLRGLKLGLREKTGIYHVIARKTGWTVARAVHVFSGLATFLAALLMAWGVGFRAADDPELVPWYWWIATVILVAGALWRGRAAFLNRKLVKTRRRRR